ncbi:MAG: hypothetical protein OXU20_26130 [Myxococcales bacterium]|nr:hypothetical protein [Myxococcales bacterium]
MANANRSAMWLATLGAIFAIVSGACGSDDADPAEEGADPGYAKVPVTGGRCQTGANDVPSSTCECPEGWRTCKDGAWSECMCPESGGCGKIEEWVCCKDEPNEYRVPCKGDESVPICNCDSLDSGLDTE